MSINAIKPKTLGINQAKTQTTNTTEERHAQQTTQTEPTTNKRISADDVFKFMSATTTTPVNFKKSVNVNEFVNEESAKRIEASIKDFEAKFALTFSSIKEEFSNMSDELAQKITLSML